VSDYILKHDKSFQDLLLSERAQLLSRVDAIEKFLEIDNTKTMRDAVKQAKRGRVAEIKKLLPRYDFVYIE